MDCFDSFGVEHILKQIGKFIGNKNAVKSIYRVQAYVSIMCGYFCIGFFFPDDYERNDKIILKYFQKNLYKLKCILIFVINTENLKITKLLYNFKKALILSIV